MSWFLKEISDLNSEVVLCLEDGRLLTGKAVGVDTSKIAAGVLKFQVGNHMYNLMDMEIADYAIV